MLMGTESAEGGKGEGGVSVGFDDDAGNDSAERGKTVVSDNEAEVGDLGVPRIGVADLKGA